jgi:hypothetical protein
MSFFFTSERQSAALHGRVQFQTDSHDMNCQGIKEASTASSLTIEEIEELIKQKEIDEKLRAQKHPKARQEEKEKNVVGMKKPKSKDDKSDEERVRKYIRDKEKRKLQLHRETELTRGTKSKSNQDVNQATSSSIQMDKKDFVQKLLKKENLLKKQLSQVQWQLKAVSSETIDENMKQVIKASLSREESQVSFSCDLCAGTIKLYSTKGNLLKHQRRIHGSESEAAKGVMNAPAKFTTCPHCGKAVTKVSISLS